MILCYSSFHQQYHILHMRRMGEHVHGLHLCHPKERVEQREVTCLSGRITTHVYDTVRCSPHVADP